MMVFIETDMGRRERGWEGAFSKELKSGRWKVVDETYEILKSIVFDLGSIDGPASGGPSASP